MRARRSWVPAAAGVAAVAAGWAVLGPIPLGGSTGYASVVGSSMEPKFQRGDLVLVRRSGEYEVGDIVAYKNRKLDRTVLHRIVAIDDGRYVLKGDANAFLDPGEVRRSDLIGRYWLTVGGAASVLGWLRIPWLSALLAGVTGLLLTRRGGREAVRQRRGAARRDAVPEPFAGRARFEARTATIAAALSLLAFALLGAIAFALPSEREVTVDRLYTQTGAFSYSASARSEAVYPDGVVRSGDAVFTRLVPRLQVGFTWRLEAEQRHLVRGRASLAAEVTDGAGWTRRLLLAGPTPFTGDRAAVGGVLDLRALVRLVRGFERATGAAVGAYQLRLVPTVALDGTVAGHIVRDRFSPALAFRLDQLRLWLAESTDPAKPNGLVREQSSAGVLSRPNEIAVLGQRVSVQSAKIVALAGASLALAVLLVLWLLGRARPEAAGGARRLRSLDGRPVVGLAEEPAHVQALQVAQLEELVRLAERSDRPILHHEPTGTFLVEDEGVAYRWREPSPRSPTAGVAEPVRPRSRAAPVLPSAEP